jgi:diguanylate cyclase (GGDEF)-like protein
MGEARGRALLPPMEFGPFDELSDVAHGLYVDGFSDRAVEVCQQWRALTDAANDASTSRYFRYIEAIAHQERDRHHEAITAASALLESLGDEPEPVWRAKSLSIIAESSTRRGDHARAMVSIGEAEWLVRSVRPGSYGHLSASMAVSLALRSLNLFEPADALLRAIKGSGSASPYVDVLVLQELTVSSLTWGATLALVGYREEAGRQFVVAASRAVAMQRRAVEAGNVKMEARGQVMEAYAALQLGESTLSVARAVSAADAFSDRPELLETHLVHLILGRTALDRKEFDEAREHLNEALNDANSAGRDTWSAVCLEALADVDVAENGRHPAIGIWKTLARKALARIWAEREGRFAALQDRHQVRELTAEAHRMGQVALQDPLTGLGNRRLLAVAIATAPGPLSAVFVDVDNFKAVNDDFSHALGDAILRKIAEILRSQCRGEEVLIRYGGDEFVVLMAETIPAADAVAHRLHEAVRSFSWHRLAENLVVTVSVGVGSVVKDDDDPLSAADGALTRAKRAGRDQVVLSG